MSRRKIGKASYADVARLMSYAYEQKEPITFQLGSEAVAIRTLQRMNQYRILDRQEREDLASVFDMFVYKRRGTIIIAERRAANPCVAMFDSEGKEIDMSALNAEMSEEEIQKQIEMARKEWEKMQEVPEDQRDRLREIDPKKPLGLESE